MGRRGFEDRMFIHPILVTAFLRSGYTADQRPRGWPRHRSQSANNVPLLLIYSNVIQVGGPNTMSKSINAARHAGYIHIIGFVSGVRMTVLLSFHNNRCLNWRYVCRATKVSPYPLPSGKASFSVGFWSAPSNSTVLLHFLFLLYWYAAGRFEDMNRLIAAREIHPVVDKIFTFQQASEAYSYLESQKHVGKVVIKIAWGVVMGYRGQRGILVWRETSAHVQSSDTVSIYEFSSPMVMVYQDSGGRRFAWFRSAMQKSLETPVNRL